jgi:hypothetical protein
MSSINEDIDNRTTAVFIDLVASSLLLSVNKG